MGKIIKCKIQIVSMTIVLVFFLFVMCILKIEPFGSNSFVTGDCKLIYYPFLMLFREKVRSGDGLLYYWTAALGDGFLPTYFCYLSSPLNYVVLLLPESWVHCYLSSSIVIRIVLASGTFAYYLLYREEKSFNKEYIIMLACAYALSGFVLGYYSQYMWLDSYVIFPIIVLGYDKLMCGDDTKVYVISLVASSLCNFFMTYVIGVFLVLWFLIDNRNTKGSFLRNFRRFIFYSLLAIGMSAFSLVISFFANFQTRVWNDSRVSHYWFGNFFNVIKNAFFLTKPVMISYDNNSANIYCGTFMVLLFFIYLLSEKIKTKEKVKKISLFLFILMSMNESILNYFWHGFHLQNGVPNRFSFLLIFLSLLMFCDSINGGISVKRTIIAIIAAVIMPMIIFCFMPLNAYFDDGVVLIIILVLTFLYSILFVFYNYTKKYIFLTVLFVIALVEIITQASISIKDYVTDKDYHNNEIDSLNAYFASYDDVNSFERSIIICSASSNIETYLNLNGITAFNGYLNSNTSSFLNNCGYFTGIVEIKDESGYIPLDDILGLNNLYEFKTLTGYENDYLNFMNYTELYNDDFLTVYKNNNACSLGFGIDDRGDLEYDGSDELNVFKNVNDIIENMSGIEDVICEIYPVYDIYYEGYDSIESADVPYVYLKCTPNSNISDPYMSLSFIAEKTGYYNLYTSMGENGYINISVNGSERRHESNLTCGGIISIGRINQGDKIELIIGKTHYRASKVSHINEYYLNIRMSILDEEKYNLFIEKIHNNQMRVTKKTDSHISATVSLENNQILFTSIPFDEGWHVYENGKEIKKEKYANTFISLDLGEGYHELQFRYIPQGLYIGMVLTIISWGIFVFVRIRDRKNLEKKNVKD